MGRPKEKIPENVIPADVLAAARRTGLEDPLWYVGRSILGKDEVVLDRTLDDVVREARGHRAKGVPPHSVEIPEASNQ